MSRLILFVTVGFPGSGKTYFSRKFASEQNYFHLSSDRLREGMFVNPVYSLEEKKVLFRTMGYIAGELLAQGTSIIYDANVIRRSQRKNLEEIAKANNAECIVLWIQTPIEVALKRNKERELASTEDKKHFKVVDEEVLYRLKTHQEDPIDEKCISINGELPYEKQKEIVLHFLKTL